MAALQTSQLNEINVFLKEKGLLAVINNYLKEYNLDYTVTAVKLKPKTGPIVAGIIQCPPGYESIEVCNRAGVCEEVCVPKF